MRLLSWNVNGLRAVYKKNFLDWFDTQQANIYCIQETKSHKNQLSEKLIERPGYESYFTQAERKGYSGAAVWTKEKPKNVSYELGIPRFGVHPSD